MRCWRCAFRTTWRCRAEPECARGIHVVVEVKLPMQRTGLEHLSLQGNSDCDRLLFAHCTYPMGRDHGGRVSLSTTARALRHAAACGTGSGGSCGAKGGVAGISTILVDSVRITTVSICSGPNHAARGDVTRSASNAAICRTFQTPAGWCRNRALKCEIRPIVADRHIVEPTAIGGEP